MMGERGSSGLRGALLRSLLKVTVLLGAAAVLVLAVLPSLRAAYGHSPILDARTVVWLAMQLHLMFAAFVLGIPIFAMIVEIVGIASGDQRYDRLAREFTRLLALAFTATAVIGLVGLAALVLLYPRFISYLAGIFSPTFLPYVLLIVADAVLLVLYYNAWDVLQGRLKVVHVAVGALLNLGGSALMAVANAWGTFMMSPAGVRETGELVSLAAAIQNPLWWPINVHRLIANVAFGGAVAAAYAAVRFLTASSEEERAHYDWMGHVGNFVAMWALIPLPFAGYWLGKEMYAYSAQMGTTLMGGAFSWLFIVQAVLIGVLFIGANYYMWIGLGRIPGGGRYLRYVLGMEVLIFVSMAVWMTPHTLVASLAEARQMGGAHHPLLGVLGVMSAKNTAVNLVILTTFLSFVFYRRANKERVRPRPSGGMSAPVFVALLSLFPVVFCGVNGFLSQGAQAEKRLPETVRSAETLETQLLASAEPIAAAYEPLHELERLRRKAEDLSRTEGIHHAAGYRVLAILFLLLLGLALADMFFLGGRLGMKLEGTILAAAAGIVLFFGVKGYFVPADVRIGYSVYQVTAVLFAMTTIVAIDLYLFFGARSLGEVKWGRMPRRSQYVLLALGVVFTLMMGLMGFVRSGIRETWHVYGVVRDTSAQAFTPTMAYASWVVAAATLAFFAALAWIFRAGGRDGVQGGGRISVFVVVVVGFFVAGMHAVPQVRDDGPVDDGPIGETPAELADAGARIFAGRRGQCLTCHSLGEDPKARCPNLEGVGERAALRKPGTPATDYLVESVYDPNAFVVAGYPANQMTPVHKPPVVLSHDEILAVITYLGSLGGIADDAFVEAVRAAQRPWRQGLLQPGGGDDGKAVLPILAGDVERGRAIFGEQGCARCHRLGSEGGQVGPELTAIGSAQSASYVLESILDPNAVIVRGYKRVLVVLEEEEKEEEDAFSWYEEETSDEYRGVPLRWEPDRERPRQLVLAVDEGGESREVEIDLGRVECLGDTVVTLRDDLGRVCGEHVDGDEESGVTLRVLRSGGWTEEHVPADDIEMVSPPASPMPTNNGDLLTPRQAYDLVAFLLSQEGTGQEGTP